MAMQIQRVMGLLVVAGIMGLGPAPRVAWSQNSELRWACDDDGLASETVAGDSRSISPETRLDRLQCLGSHNSYHVAPGPIASRLIGLASPQGARSLNYTHPPLEEQVGRLGLRQFELDLYRDPEGGLYADPLAVRIAKEEGSEEEPFEADAWRAAGTKVFHAPDFDFRTRCVSLSDALTTLRDWSRANPEHAPIFLLLELKEESYSPTTRPPAWDAEALVALEQEILAVLPRELLVTPDDLRGEARTLREAVLGRGWPTLAETRGRFVLLLDNEDGVRRAYLEPDAVLSGRLMFVSVGMDHPAAAFRKLNDPVGQFDEIRRSVMAGLLVRTRADAELGPLRAPNWTRRERAIESGAQLISTDFPEAHPERPEYVVRFGEGEQVRVNPVTGDR